MQEKNAEIDRLVRWKKDVTESEKTIQSLRHQLEQKSITDSDILVVRNKLQKMEEQVEIARNEGVIQATSEVQRLKNEIVSLKKSQNIDQSKLSKLILEQRFLESEISRVKSDKIQSFEEQIKSLNKQLAAGSDMKYTPKQMETARNEISALKKKVKTERTKGIEDDQQLINSLRHEMEQLSNQKNIDKETIRQLKEHKKQLELGIVNAEINARLMAQDDLTLLRDRLNDKKYTESEFSRLKSDIRQLEEEVEKARNAGIEKAQKMIESLENEILVATGGNTKEILKLKKEVKKLEKDVLSAKKSGWDESVDKINTLQLELRAKKRTPYTEEDLLPLKNEIVRLEELMKTTRKQEIDEANIKIESLQAQISSQQSDIQIKKLQVRLNDLKMKKDIEQIKFLETQILQKKNKVISDIGSNQVTGKAVRKLKLEIAEIRKNHLQVYDTNESHLSSIRYDFLDRDNHILFQAMGEERKAVIVCKKDRIEDLKQKLSVDYTVKDLDGSNIPPHLKKLHLKGVKIVEIEMRKPPVDLSTGIAGGRILPLPVDIGAPGSAYITKRIRNTETLESYAKGAYRKVLAKDGISHVTTVKGDGNCGFYSLYLATKMQKYTEIQESAIDLEVVKMKELVKNKAKSQLTTLRGSDLDGLKLKMSRAVAHELLEQRKGFVSKQFHQDAVENVKKLFEGTDEAFTGQRYNMIREAELFQQMGLRYKTSGSQAKEFIDINGKNFQVSGDLDEDILNLSLLIQGRPDLGDLYGKWVVDNSGTKLDDIGIGIMAHEMGRPIVVRNASNPDNIHFFDPDVAGADPVYLVNRGGHWDLGHLTPQKTKELLERRITDQMKILDSMKEDAQGIQAGLLRKYKKNYRQWLERNFSYF